MTLTCLACGSTGRDVAMRLVEVPEAERRVVTVAVVELEDRLGVKGFDHREVRERYVNEPRCRDTTACDARVRALAVPPAAEVDDEVPSWLR